MANPTETYVDPSIAGDSGTGTSGDPYGDLQYALNTMTRDATNGDRINIKAGTDEILGATLSFATYGTPTSAAPLIFMGYTSAAGDGGIGGIDCNSQAVFTAPSYTHFVDLHFHNSNAAQMILTTGNTLLCNCEFNDSTTYATRLKLGCVAINCYFHDVQRGIYINAASGIEVIGCTFFNDGTTDMLTGIYVQSSSSVSIIGNIMSLDGASDGILDTSGALIMHNSIYSNGGTGSGISATAGDSRVILNNKVEGFSGVGGIGIEVAGANVPFLYGFNDVYNCATDFSVGDIAVNLGSNTSLGSSPFTDAANGDFDPVTGANGAYPTTWKGSTFSSTAQNLVIGAAHYTEGGGGTTGKQGLHPIESGSA